MTANSAGKAEKTATTDPPAHVRARRQHIIATTRELIAELGIEGITMRDLAARCNVAVATLYNQFGSREDVIASALKTDFEGRFLPLSQDLTPAQKLEARISKSARDVMGPMRDYTRSVMYFYFHYKPESTMRAMIHDFIAADFTDITRDIKARGDLQDWAPINTFSDDLITQLYSLTSKWSQGHIPDRRLKSRLLLAATASYIGVSRGKTRQQFEMLAASIS
jgi:AcrR family transcriptional regulator